MINSLLLKNWKSHEETSLRFGKGSNLFIGKMGSGKSSVMDAISFALFGTFPALKSRKVKLEELVMQRPKKHSAGIVELEFTHVGKNYRAVRQFGEKATTAQLFEDGKLMEAQTSRVTELIESILGVDYDLFSRIIYAEQNKIDYILTLQKGERKRQIDELLGIARFEAARQNAGLAASKLSSKKSELERYLEGAGIAKLRQEETEKEAEIAKLKEGIKEAGKKLAHVKEKIHEGNKQLQKLELAEREFTRLEKTLAGKEGLLNGKKRELAEAEKLIGANDAEKLISEIKSLGGQAVKIESLRQENANKHSNALARIKVLLAEKGKLDRRALERHSLLEKAKAIGQASALKLAHEIAQGEFSQTTSLLATKEAQNKELEKSQQALHHADAKCPICESDLTPGRKRQLEEQRHAHIARLGEEIKRLHSRASEERGKIEKLSSLIMEAQTYEARLVEFGDVARDLLECSNELEKLGGDEPKLKRGRDEAQINGSEISGKILGLERELLNAQKAPKIRVEIEGLDGEIIDLNAEIARISHSPEKIAHLRMELIKEERESASLESQHAAISRNLLTLESAFKQLRQKIADLKAREEELLELAKKAQKLISFQEAVLETQTLMRSQLIEAMNEAMNSLWGSIYPYGDYRALMLSPSFDDYELMLQTPDGQWIGIENCSGGEKSCAALTLRVAFAMVLTPNLSWLILDEPTHNLDSQAVNLLNRALRDEIPKIVEQTFIITHDEALKEGASSKVFYFERDKDSGDRAVVEELSAE